MDEKKLEELAAQAAAFCGVELYHLDWTGSGRRQVMRVYVDKLGGVTIADCEHVSRELSTLLDAEDPIPGRYFLEVSSPGMDRRLYQPRHYQDNVGKEAEIKTLQADPNGDKRWVGALKGASEQGFHIEIEGKGEKYFAYAEVASARLRVKF